MRNSLSKGKGKGKTVKRAEVAPVTLNNRFSVLGGIDPFSVFNSCSIFSAESKIIPKFLTVSVLGMFQLSLRLIMFRGCLAYRVQKRGSKTSMFTFDNQTEVS